MTDKMEEQLELDGTTFEICAFKVPGRSKYSSTVCTAAFVPVLATKDDFATPEEAIAAGRNLLLAKLAEKPSLRQRIARMFLFFLQIIAMCMLIAVIQVVSAIDWLRRPSR
jgi:hypothetical protein